MQELTSQLFRQLVRGELTDDSHYSSFYLKSNWGPMVRFTQCTFLEKIVLEENFNYVYRIEFDNCIIVADLIIEAGNFPALTFRNTELVESRGVYINGGQFVSLNYYDQCRFYGAFVVRNAQINVLHMEGGQFSKGFSFLSGSILEWYLGTVKFLRGLHINGGHIGGIRVADADINGLYIAGAEIGVLNIYGLSAIGKIYLVSGIIDLLYLNTPNLEEIIRSNEVLAIKQLIFGQLGKLQAHFSNMEIGKIRFDSGFLYRDSVVWFRQVNCDDLEFVQYVIYGQLVFSGFKLNQNIVINESDLGKTAFINTQLDMANFRPEDAKINEIFFSNAAFPNHLTASPKQQQLAYAQFKKISESKGDQLEANRFFAREMNAFYQTLNWRRDFWEKLNLALNKYSSDHGQSWPRGLRFLAMLGILLFSCYLLLLGITPGSPGVPKRRQLFFECWSRVFEFTNPVHKTDAIAAALNINPNPGARIFEEFSRILIAYAIFQMVQAFRKHGKK
jgi:hypothetical protein